MTERDIDGLINVLQTLHRMDTPEQEELAWRTALLLLGGVAKDINRIAAAAEILALHKQRN